MALISKIRQNSWLLVTVIGLALAAFVMMDMMGNSNRMSAGDFTMGSINGEPIDYKEFQNTEQVLYTGGGNTYANRNYLWNFFVEKTLVGQYAEKLGLGVSKEELMELQFGNKLSPIITQRFINQNTGQIDRASLNNMRSRLEADDLDPSQRAYWRVQEKEIVANRIQDKVNTMVSKAIYTPKWMAEVRNTEQKATIAMDYVKIPFTKVENTEVSMSDADLTAYLNNNKETYRQSEETRTAEYVIFDILPTKLDTQDIINSLDELKTKLIAAEDDSTFIVNQNGIYNMTYLKENEISPALKDTIFDLEVGTVYGPFLEGNQYQVIKVIDNKILPDSVESRHILRPVKTQEEFIAANTLIDSLISEINAGTTTFAEAAERFGTDGTRSSGGDLGFAAPGAMVKQFNDMIFFQAKKGELNKVITQFGLHLVEVTDQKFESNERGVKYSVLFKNIVPSQETQQAENDRVFDFLSENNSLEKLRAAIPSLGKELKISPALQRNDYTFPEIGTSATSRDIIRWLFTPGIKEGETSPEVYIYKDPTLYYNSKLIITGLSEISEGDFPSLASMRSNIEPLVINMKKGELIKSQVSGKNMTDAAAQYDVEVQQAQDVNMASSFVPGLGNEPEVLGRAFAAGSGETVGPIVGKEGVYYVKVTSRSDAPPVDDIAQKQNTFAALSRRLVNTKLWDAVKSGNEIEDNRYRYY
jgi:peptidyl-prolyl cis-trans isomerase D